MRLVVQRVNYAAVCVGKEVLGEIGKGFFVLAGVADGDTKNDAEVLAEKLSKLRIMVDENGKMNLSVKDAGGSVLVVSQFTLHADTAKGNQPSFVGAANPKLAEEIYDHFVSKLENLDVKVETGKFGAYMEIQAELDGPVTLIIDSSK
jgi:D-tyrosyl-tRNA(Tyr) deacylase